MYTFVSCFIQNVFQQKITRHKRKQGKKNPTVKRQSNQQKLKDDTVDYQKILNDYDYYKL